MKSQTEIQATAIFKVTIRETGKQCFAVPSDSQSGVYYITCYDEHLNIWTCTCKCGEVRNARAQDAGCKHARAAQVVIRVHKADEIAAQAERVNMSKLATYKIGDSYEQLTQTCQMCGRNSVATVCGRCVGY